jgi:DNA/RNA-binding domain of Phe-tRNA-synthetase-like protein
VKAEYPNIEALSASTLVTEWREVYHQQGVKPSQFRSSIEALARRVVADKPIAIGVLLVDFYNLHSLRYQACLGGYDMKKLPDSEIVLRLCDIEGDKFTPLGGVAADFPLNPKLAVYALKSEILCWGFNCRDSAMTALDESTDDALFFAEAVTIGQKKRGRAALNAMVKRLANADASVSDIF